MVTTTYSYDPDYAVPPGWVLEERLAAHKISHAEFARRCGRSPKLISEIVAGKAPIEPKTAIQFERVLGVDAGIWLGIESDYRLHLEREAEMQKAEQSVAWAKQFPINELVRRGVVSKPTSSADKVRVMLSFFGVASVEAWQLRLEGARVAYRHSPSFKSDEFALATWLRLGEMEAEQYDCANYNASRFRNALTRIRQLTTTPSSATLERAHELCKRSGVVLAIVKPLPKTALSGATRWLTPRRALIQLSGRHMSDDQLWFSFFHEAAHLLLHSKRAVFVHESQEQLTKADVEANQWAANFLVPPSDWEEFTMNSRFSRHSVVGFAEEQGIAPGIVVGRLQHEGHLPWGHLNYLKTRLAWADDAVD